MAEGCFVSFSDTTVVMTHVQFETRPPKKVEHESGLMTVPTTMVRTLTPDQGNNES